MPRESHHSDWELLLEEFEEAWEQGRRPSIAETLALGATEERQQLLIELVHIELERRLKAGEQVTVESYCLAFPELLMDPNEVEALKQSWLRFGQQTGANAGATLPHAPAERSTEPRDREVRTVTHYRVQQLHARGGLGEILLAQDTLLHRPVALKQLQRNHAKDRESRARFLREAELTSQLEHPGVVPIYGLGQAADSTPLYAMRFVRGQTLHEAAQQFHTSEIGKRANPYATSEFRHLLSRFVSVCNTVAYAHSRGVLHRDLKPANILLGPYGETLVVDWGLAKRFTEVSREMGWQAPSAEPNPTCEATQQGTLIGTPAYMSPEQAFGPSEALAPTSDIYSLGATLFVLLTGQVPFREKSLEQVLSRLKAGDLPRVPEVRSEVPAPLAAICTKAMQPKPEQRYTQALDLAADLEHWLADEPVSVYAEPWTKRTQRWLANHRTLVSTLFAASVVTAIALLVATALLTAAHQRESEAKLLAQNKLDQADRSFYSHRVTLADRDMWNGRIAEARRFLQECRPDLRQWEWHYLHRLCHAEAKTLGKHTDVAWGVAYSPDGKLLVSVGLDRLVQVWDVNSGELLHTLTGHRREIWGVAFNAQGTYLATCGSGPETLLWDTQTWSLQRTLTGTKGEYTSVTFVDDTHLLLAQAEQKSEEGDSAGAFELWDWQKGELVQRLGENAYGASSVQFDAKHRRVVVAYVDGSLQLWDYTTRTLQQKWVGHRAPARQAIFSHDGKHIYSSGWDLAIRVWDAQSGKPVRHPQTGEPLVVFNAHSLQIWGLALSPDGKQLASSGDDHVIKLWDTSSWQELATWRGHSMGIANIAFRPDGSQLASASDDTTVKLWHTDLMGEVQKLPTAHRATVWSVVFSADGERLVSTSDDAMIRVRRSDTLALVHSWRARKGVACVALHPRSKQCAYCTDDGSVFLRDLEGDGAEERELQQHRGIVWSVAYSPDGSRLASAGSDGLVCLWEAQSGRLLHKLQGHTGTVRALAFHPSGTSLVSAGADTTLRIWHVETGQPERTCSGHADGVLCVRFSPDGTQLVSGSQARMRSLVNEPGELFLWDYATGEVVRKMRGQRSSIEALLFTPDGSRLFASTGDGSLRVLEPTTGHEALVIPTNSVPQCLGWHAGRQQLVSGHRNGSLRFWTGLPSEEREK